MREIGKRAFEPVKSFAHRRISNTIFGRCRYSNFLQTLTVKHFHSILTFFVVSEWNLAYKWSDSRLKYAKTQSFLLFLSLFANHEYCVTVLVTSLISSLFRCERQVLILVDGNISTQHIATLLVATCYARLAISLRSVASCWWTRQIFHATFVDVAWYLLYSVGQVYAMLRQGMRTSSICRTQNAALNVATGWPNARNILRPTMICGAEKLPSSDRVCLGHEGNLVPWIDIYRIVLIVSQSASSTTKSWILRRLFLS